MFKNVTILDNAGQAFFARELEHIKATSYDVIYADLIARELFPVSNEAPEGVDSITYRTYDMVGSARIINNYADDLPRADIMGKEVTIPARAIGTSFGYSRDEILKSQMTGLPLDQRRANAAQRAWEEKVDSIAWLGSAIDGLIGFLSHPNIPSLASGVAGGWIASGDPDAIIADVNAAFGKVRADTRMKENPNTLLLPVLEYNYISGTPRASNSDTTILTFLLANVIGLKEVRPVNELVTDAVIYDKSPDKLQLEIPKELEFLPPQEVGLELKIPAWGKTAGVNIYYPLSVLKITSINA